MFAVGLTCFAGPYSIQTVQTSPREVQPLLKWRDGEVGPGGRRHI